jgi:hypothetical protein
MPKKMKKFIYCLMAILLSLSFFPLQSRASTTNEPSSGVTKAPEPVESSEIKELLKKVEVSNTSENTKLIPHASKTQEVEIVSTSHHHGRTYVSVGVLVLIVILVVVLV